MRSTFDDSTVRRQAKELLSAYALCDACLGRQFTHLERGSTNEYRGQRLKEIVNHTTRISHNHCWLCEGLIAEIPHFATLLQTHLQQYEFDTFLLGSKIDEDIIARELHLQETVPTNGAESIKLEINREIGKQLEQHLKKTVDFEHPTIMAILDTVFDDISLQIQPLYLYGRYKKFSRELPQTRWFCQFCRGKGCRRCNYTGTLYESSVEQLIGTHILNATQATGVVLHGCGREDIDVRMLGNGRPFVVEASNPHKRTLLLNQLQAEINKQSAGLIEVSSLRYADKNEVSRIKTASFRKKYRVVFIGEHVFGNEKLKEAARILQRSTIKQQTPTRVAHRRANKVRHKKIYSCKLESVEDNIATFILDTESGTYIKELITGDEGKTKPNLSELLKIPCTVKELDVIEIKGE